MKHRLLILVLFIYSLTIYAQNPEWISFFNGPTNFADQIENVAFDNLGNIYLSGYGYETVGGQGQDFFTVKCNSSGNEVWQKVYNGPQNDTDRPFGIFVDENGNVYVTGTSRWNSNAYKIVTLKYSADGNLSWICAFDSLGQSDGEAHDVCVDNNGNVYVTGRISPLNNGYYDLGTIKMDSNGNVLDYTYYGQPLGFSEDGTNIITDSDGNVYVGGHGNSSSFGQEAVIIKYNSSLDTLWTVHINGNDNSFNEFTIDIALDNTNNIYTLCRLQNDPGFTDFSTLKINSSGQIIWRKDFDEASGQDIPEDMTMDTNGNIYVTGRVRRTSYNDFAVIKYNNAGTQQWVSYYDGPNNFDDDPTSITLDQSGNIFVCGEINPDGGSHFKLTVVKFNSDGSFDWDYIYDENVSSKAVGIWADNSGFVYTAGEGDNPNGNYDLMAVSLSKITGVEDEGNLPAEFSLSQNYPNPFNPATNFEFRIADFGFVSLKIYDLLGREISTLVTEEKPAGEYKIEFNASGLSSGVYFYQLKVGNKFIQTKQFVLLK
jgi:uncharacterized delta-60 repeat protein